MSPRAHVYPLALVAMLLLPSAASALTMGTFTVNGGSPVVAGTTAQAVCTAVPSGTGFFADTPVTATFGGGGTFAPGTAAFVVGADGWTYTATSTWTAPAAGIHALTCQGTGSRLGAGGTLTVNVTVTDPPAAPVISAITGASGMVFTGASISLGVEASDPGNLPPLTYAWSGPGTFGPAGATTSWTAPELPGSYELVVTVTNAGGQFATRPLTVNTVLSAFQGSLSAAMPYPRRVAANVAGDLYVVDEAGALHLLTKRGGGLSSLPTLGATAVAVAPDGIYVATNRREILKLDAASGRRLARIPWNASSAISGLAWAPSQNLLWVANFEARRAVAIDASGNVVRSITEVQGRPLLAVADVAVDAATDTLWVAEKDGSTGNRIHAFNLADGAYVRSMVTGGSGPAMVFDTGGIALDGAGRVYVSDAFNGTVQVMKADGTFVGTIGSKGDVDGYLLHPRGLAFMSNGDLAIANSYFNRVDRFGTGALLSTCPGDADCDGLPDDWERANGFDPNDAGDALLDPDGDGLNDREEFALGTNPRKADTDGDGMFDGPEVLAGRDPLNAGDALPTLSAGNLGQVGPGIVQLNVVASNVAGCTAVWSQVSGPSVALRSADTFTPSFVARAAGVYKFQANARCASVNSAPAVAQVEVLNVAPVADAGRLVVTEPHRPVVLNGGFSSDANGDALTFSWDQVAGPSLSMAARGGQLTVRPSREGYYAFELTARERSGTLFGRTLVGVAVVDDALPTAVVAAPLVIAAPGESVVLDASASVPADCTVAWQQVEGSSVGAIAAGPAPAVTIPAPGRYVFEATAQSRGVASPPSRLVVLAGFARALPAAIASGPATGSVNTALTLDGSGSAGASAYAWRQVVGPAAGLSGADGAVATAVPFAAGFYAFELTVTDASGAQSVPARVEIAVASPGKPPLPVASIAAPANASVGELVVLNGRGSTRGSRFRWTQTSGPWVALDGSNGTPVFTPSSSGSYTFELVVEDDGVRSAPATVTVVVQ